MIKIKPIIGIVGRLYSGESNIICVEEVRLAVTKFGGIPLLILPVDKVDISLKEPCNEPFYSEEEIKDLEMILKKCDGFILPGGNVCYQLDEVVIDYAIKWDKPLLGICLGMQTLSKVLSGEKEIAYDNTIKNNTCINHLEPNKKYVHLVIIDENSKLYSIIGEKEILVNSRHSYHVPELDNTLVSARSSDGLIEGVELKDKKFIIGVQWHPESNLEDKYSKKLFKAFFINCEIHKNFIKKICKGL